MEQLSVSFLHPTATLARLARGSRGGRHDGQGRIVHLGYNQSVQLVAGPRVLTQSALALLPLPQTAGGLQGDLL